MSWIMITKSLAFTELSSALSPFYNRNTASKIRTGIYMCVCTHVYKHIQVLNQNMCFESSFRRRN